jgi:hypothetical protein
MGGRRVLEGGLTITEVVVLHSGLAGLDAASEYVISLCLCGGLCIVQASRR